MADKNAPDGCCISVAIVVFIGAIMVVLLWHQLWLRSNERETAQLAEDMRRHDRDEMKRKQVEEEVRAQQRAEEQARLQRQAKEALEREQLQQRQQKDREFQPLCVTPKNAPPCVVGSPCQVSLFGPALRRYAVV